MQVHNSILGGSGCNIFNFSNYSFHRKHINLIEIVITRMAERTPKWTPSIRLKKWGQNAIKKFI